MAAGAELHLPEYREEERERMRDRMGTGKWGVDCGRPFEIYAVKRASSSSAIPLSMYVCWCEKSVYVYMVSSMFG